MNTRLPMLLVSVGGVVAGASKAWNAGIDTVSAALIAASLIILGAWLTLEIDSTRRKTEGKEPHDGTD